MALGPLFPDKLCLGLEIRDRVVQYVGDRVQALRHDLPEPNRPKFEDDEDKDKDEPPAKKRKAAAAAAETPAPVDPSSAPSSEAQTTSDEKKQTQHSYDNISVVKTNIMKYAVNYFYKGQLEKMFFCFPDPHFKRSNHRRRVINENFLAVYAYLLKPGGILYTISDVKELHEWMAKHASEHPLFEPLTPEEMAADPCVQAMTYSTEEGKKVARNGGSKYPAVFRRKPDPQP